MKLIPILLVSAFLAMGCVAGENGETNRGQAATAEAPAATAIAAKAEAADTIPQLVRPDGSYPVAPLEKDVIVLKVLKGIWMVTPDRS